ncbi:LON peptidase N-terminal domain and RING finger protein 3 [Perkinsus olseni]|uniref:LON peptidase N-terminal domain and RING finger protein 3 n=1 Tax=Perkinsus olseni TaxID=32597 RepID=A0A7J6UM16_PEROL|nr:LON peptidase N-terminal domain and RING finger protein 3 [Perkinsus olseni]
MDHRQLCPSCRAPCPFIGSTNVMVANLIQQRFPEEYALRSKEVRELEEEEKANAPSDDADGSAQGVFFPFVRYEYRTSWACRKTTSSGFLTAASSSPTVIDSLS